MVFMKLKMKHMKEYSLYNTEGDYGYTFGLFVDEGDTYNLKYLKWFMFDEDLW
jgi:hypothetical protein